MKKNILYKIVIVLLSIFFLICLYFLKLGFFEKISLGINDYKYKIKSIVKEPTINEKIVVVAVDEKSVNKLGRWPWNRKVIGDTILKLRKAKVVALDIVFSEYSYEEEDNYLINALLETGNVIGGFFFRGVATEQKEEYLIDILSDSAIFRYKLLDDTLGLKEFNFVESNTLEITESLAASAFFTIEPDIDGLYRNYPFFYIYKGLIFPSLGLQILRFYENSDIYAVFDKNGVVEFSVGGFKYKNSNTLKLNYYDNINYISAYDVYSGKVSEEFFKDKIVIVGITETGIFDLRPTPIDSITPGVSLHATFVSNFLDNNLIVEKNCLNIFYIVLIAILVFSLSFFKKIYTRIFAYLFAFFLLYVSSMVLFINNNLWINDFYFFLSFFTSGILVEIISFILTDLRAIEIKRAFSSYVSPHVVDMMIENPDKLKLGGETREITVLFTDIRGFTTISEGLSSEEVVLMLNQLNSPLTKTILKYNGLLDKYIGDAIMAIFNAPIDVENHADMACKSALEMLQVLADVNKKFAEQKLPSVNIGIGINTGIATVGNIGSEVRFDYTAIGDTVNLASRLEGLNKVYKTHIIISEFVKEKLRDNYCLRLLDKVVVKGKEKPVTIYEILEENEKNKLMAEKFKEGMNYYFQRDFAFALKIFTEIYNEFNDVTSEIFIDRCKYYLQNPPESSWNGAHIAQSK